MVLEALANPILAEKKPWTTFFIGIINASIGAAIGLIFFRDFASIVMVALTAMVSVPLIYGAIKLEEKKDLIISDEKMLLKEHSKVLSFFIFMFLGFVAAFAVWYLALSPENAGDLFSYQISTIKDINSLATGNLFSLSSSFFEIIINNLKVLVFCLIFAFFYGFGAIFILTWNASILATVIGQFIRTNSAYALAPIVLFKYCLHGIPEIAAYFIGGLAGGIISIAVIRHDYGSPKFKNILKDSLDLILISVTLIILAAFIEVFISVRIMG